MLEIGIILYGIVSIVVSMFCTHYICETKYHWVVWDMRIIKPALFVIFFIFWPLLVVGHWLQAMYMIWRS